MPVLRQAVNAKKHDILKLIETAKNIITK